MRPLTVPELLTVWESGLGKRPYERALAILGAANPEITRADLARVSIGRRDASLLRLREWAFGAELAMMASCPRCQGALETTVETSNLRGPLDEAGESETRPQIGEYEFLCRAPNTEDLEACAGLDAERSRGTLLGRCVLEASRQGTPLTAKELPGEVVEAVIERIAEADRGEIGIAMSCPDCEYRWSETFDIVSFFWTEIDAWARRLLRETHVLASTYGWSESDILELSPTRRQIYLGMAEA